MYPDLYGCVSIWLALASKIDLASFISEIDDADINCLELYVQHCQN